MSHEGLTQWNTAINMNELDPHASIEMNLTSEKNRMQNTKYGK